MKIWISLGATAVVGGIAYFFLKASRFGAESIPYTVRYRDGAFELRDYPSLAVARTAMRGASADPSFGELFRFITGANQREEKIAMTTPVLIEGPIGRQTTMSFGMPAETRRRGIPQPGSDRVELSEEPPAQIATFRFSGPTRESAERTALKELRAWMQTHGLEAVGEPIIAYYDAPFIPGPLRRNEAMLRVRPL